MKRYETYKNSGVEWIGEIPEGWECVKIKFILDRSKEGIKIGPFGSSLTGKVGSEGQYKVYGQWNIIGKDFTAGKNFVDKDTFESLESYQIIPGDILISMMGTVGKCAIIPNGIAPGIMDSHVVKARLNTSSITPSFFSYVYDKDNSNVVFSQIMKYRRGSIMDGLNSTTIKDFDLPLPSLSEQQQISSYLDYKVGQIDTAISKIADQIDDLKSYRQSIISEAVTKGLNPYAKMKDSGVEWIGEIPEGWKVLPLMRVASIQTGTTPSTSNENYWNSSDFSWYTPIDFSDDKLYLEESKRKVSQYAKDSNSCRVFPAKTVMLVGIGATLGRIGFAENECSANQQINAIVFDEKISPYFGAYYLQSIKQFIVSRANSATLAIINQTETGKLPMILPSLSEQLQIASCLDSKTSKIDSSIEALELQKSQLEDYKRSVISEAVTGKVDLRDWTPKNEQ